MISSGLKHLLLLAAVVLTAACAQSPHVFSQADLSPSAKFSWLEGCWESTSGTTREIWTQSYDGLLFGHSVTQRDGEVVFFEDLRIEAMGDSGVYVASPGGNAPVQFAMSYYADGAATFINEDHDDPQRITYALTKFGLTVVISLIDGSNDRAFVFTPCAVKQP